MTAPGERLARNERRAVGIALIALAAAPLVLGTYGSATLARLLAFALLAASADLLVGTTDALAPEIRVSGHAAQLPGRFVFPFRAQKGCAADVTVLDECPEMARG